MLLLFAGSSFADDNPDSTSTFIPNVKPELNIPRLAAENIKIDGELNEYVWEKAAVANNFTEISPGDNAKPEVETEARVFYDDDYLYFGFICYENDMKNVRATIGDRDRMYADDWVGRSLTHTAD